MLIIFFCFKNDPGKISNIITSPRKKSSNTCYLNFLSSNEIKWCFKFLK